MRKAQFAIVNATLAQNSRLVADQSLIIEDSVIGYVGRARRLPTGSPTIDLAGRFVLPGLVDLHAHGALGRTFNESDEAAWQVVLDAHLRAGTTSLLATLASDSAAAMSAAIAVQARLPASTTAVGCHLEGPYLSPQFSGAHPPEALRAPPARAWAEVLGGAGVVKMVTLAPELPGALEASRELAAAGVIVSAGHSGATPEVMDAARAAGVRHVAHLWSGQSTLTKEGPWRRPGLLEYALASADLTAEIIADGCHLPAALVKIAFRCLGPRRLCLVSDASAGAGLPVGARFEMGAASGIVAQGVAVTSDGKNFCGSTSFLADTLRFAVRHARIPLADAIDMATVTPAGVLGLSDRVGVLAPGRAADLLVLDHDLSTLLVFKAAERVAGPPTPYPQSRRSP